jgi:NitT/TauT family transport system substrate-binding protein
MTAGLAITAAAGCDGGSSGTINTTAAIGGLEKTHLKIAYLPITQSVPLFIAIKDGFFKHQGLTVTPVLAQSSKIALAGLEKGSIDIIEGANYESFFALQAAGRVNIRIIVDASECDPNALAVLVMPGSGITRPSDLAGKTIAVNINPNIQTLTINAQLQADHVNVGTVHYNDSFPFPVAMKELAARKIPAISEVEPFITEAELLYGAVPVLSECTGPTAGVALAGDISTANWARTYPNTARAFQRAMEQAQAVSDTNRGEAEQALSIFLKGAPPEMRALVDIGVFPSSIDSARLQSLIDLMVNGGLLKPGQISAAALVFH